MKKKLLPPILLFLLALVLELGVFNFRHLVTALDSLHQRLLPASSLRMENGEYQDGRLRVKEGEPIYIYNIGKELKSVELLADTQGQVYTYDLLIQDQAYSKGWRYAGTYSSIWSVPRSKVASIHSNGKASALQIVFTSLQGDLFLYGAALNPTVPMNFSIGRLFWVSAVLLGGWLFFKKRLWAVEFCPQNPRHRFSVAAVILLGMLFCGYSFITTIPDTEWYLGQALSLPYTGDALSYSDAYHQQLDAWIKWQAELDIPVDPALQTLENPYDPSQRSEAGVPFAYDRAYYNGSYYSYYGVGPLVAAYLPFYLLTGRMLSTQAACLVFGMSFCLAMPLAVMQLLFRLVKRVNLPVLLIGALAVVLGGGAMWCVRIATFYEVPVLAALSFLAAFLFFGARGANLEKPSSVYMALSGISYIFMVASRPNFGLYGLLLAPIFWQFLFHKGLPGKKRAASAAAFGLPVLLGAAALMWYNAVRFDSLFEFGAVYNLTISDVRYNTLFKLGNFFPTVYHYLLQLPTFDLYFPFFRLSGMDQVAWHNYYYAWPTVGLLGLPGAVPALGLPFLAKGEKNRLLRHTMVLFLLVPLFLCFFDFSVAGIFTRYAADVLPIFLFGGVLYTVVFLSRTKGDSADKKQVTIAIILFFCTALIGIFLSFSGYFGHFLIDSPKEYIKLQTVFQWWT